MKKLLFASVIAVGVCSQSHVHAQRLEPGYATTQSGKSAPTLVLGCPGTDTTTIPGQTINIVVACSFGGSNGTSVVGQNVMAQSAPVVIASDQSSIPVKDPNNPAFGDMVPITPGTAFTAGRSFAFLATTAGTISITLATNGRVVAIPIIASASIQTLPFAITNLTLGSASGTFWNLP